MDANSPFPTRLPIGDMRRNVLVSLYQAACDGSAGAAKVFLDATTKAAEDEAWEEHLDADGTLCNDWERFQNIPWPFADPATGLRPETPDELEANSPFSPHEAGQGPHIVETEDQLDETAKSDLELLRTIDQWKPEKGKPMIPATYDESDWTAQ